MRVRHIDLNASLDVDRGAVVVCIPVQATSEHLPRCLRAVLEHTPAAVPIIVCDGESGSAQSIESTLTAIQPPNNAARQLLYLRPDDGAGLASAVNGGLSIAAPADCVLLAAECVVAAHWLERLGQAVEADSTVATASALACGPRDWSVRTAATVRSQSLRLHPRLESAQGPCVYVRRAALELAGDVDASLVAGRGEPSEFSQRCVRNGLVHVLADDVLVLDGIANGSHGHWIRSPAPADSVGPLARSLSRIRRTLNGPSVVIDARILAGPITGTRVQVLETIAALARLDRVRVTAVVPDSLSGDAARSLESLTPVSLATQDQATRFAGRRADLVHRPSQINNPGDLAFLLAVADRLIITQEDLISYYNASYFPSLEAWRAHRRLTRTALAIADRVLFVSAYARDKALSDDLVAARRASVVPNGVDHKVTAVDQRPVRPAGAARLPDDAQIMLCLGTDYHHKNRLFALRVMDELERRHGWRGRLVLAGPHVAHGSSAPDEQSLLAQKPELADAVLDLGPVSGAEKAWLLNRAALVIYPTISEGFGLVPFEAASHGVPCMWAVGTSLSEFLPEAAYGIAPWDAETSADRALKLLRNERARACNVESIRTAGERLTWDAAATRLLEVYEATCDAPAPATALLERRHGLITGGLGEDAMRLMGPGGALPEDIERPLLALATHPWIGSPVFRVLRFGYETSYKLRRWGRARERTNGPVER